MYQPKTQELSTLLKKVTKEFKQRKWLVETINDYRYDLAVANLDIKFSVKVLDSSTLRYLSPSTLLEQMETETNKLKITNHAPLLFFLNFDFTDAFALNAQERGILFAKISSLSEVAGVERFQRELPHGLTSLETSLVATQWKACISISDRFKMAGDIEVALGWAKFAVDTTRASTPIPYRRLIELLLALQKLDEAETATLTALDLWRNDLGLLKTVALISHKRGYPAVPSPWRERLDAALAENEKQRTIINTAAPKFNSQEQISEANLNLKKSKISLFSLFKGK